MSVNHQMLTQDFAPQRIPCYLMLCLVIALGESFGACWNGHILRCVGFVGVQFCWFSPEAEFKLFVTRRPDCFIPVKLMVSSPMAHPALWGFEVEITE